MSFLSRLETYIHRNLISTDQMANTVCGGNPDETLSSRAQKAKERWEQNHLTKYLWGCILCEILGAIIRDHCIKSVERDESK